MAWLTFEDLRRHALWLAGERPDPPTLSPYYGIAGDYVNAIQLDLVVGRLLVGAGETIGVPQVNWWWARVDGVAQTLPIWGQHTTVTVTEGSSTALMSKAVTINASGYRLLVAGAAITPRVTTHVPTTVTLTLDSPWPEVTRTASFHLFQPVVALPAGFLRFVGPPVDVAAGEPLELLDPAQVEADRGQWRPGVGTPTRARWLTDTTLELDAVPEEETRYEFSYLSTPPLLAASGDLPRVPEAHRRTLALGAAALIAFDKSDTIAADLVRQYHAGYQALIEAHESFTRLSAPDYARVLPRRDARAPRLRTASGVWLA